MKSKVRHIGLYPHNRHALKCRVVGWMDGVDVWMGGAVVEGATWARLSDVLAFFVSYGPWAGQKYVAAEVLGAWCLGGKVAAG